MVFVVRISGDAPSESEESPSSGSGNTGAGCCAGNGGCEGKKPGATWVGAAGTFKFTTPPRPPEGPFLLLRPRLPPRPLFAP